MTELFTFALFGAIVSAVSIGWPLLRRWLAGPPPPPVTYHRWRQPPP